MKKLTSKGLRTEITLGLRIGYKGELLQKESITALLKKLISQGKTFPWRLTGAELVYPVQEKAVMEPAIVLSSDKNSRYGNELSEEEWIEVVENTAEALRKNFDQVRVYVSYLQVEVVILEEGENEG